METAPLNGTPVKIDTRAGEGVTCLEPKHIASEFADQRLDVAAGPVKDAYPRTRPDIATGVAAATPVVAIRPGL